ncbi:hypothetical protein SARC_03819 [Sphaeroforma arctica JP610]|uniref:Uncharacterized protein n=1 Tax=Sphaeroforma arctica JP610 TaxID=667725 RepID=A0A0L0G4H5_9EUKA|nr:hypothetical protein SARC_03819 [Sphaeroforma arctica JP610]KNC83955.1 hypothetical protein SARC_03819 [Sphaeroforma arctica JP610]|eukprot:XP_014157857.1 hypothetical protein SARC_03819 [Sphaeroforma arctica JP610]
MRDVFRVNIDNPEENRQDKPSRPQRIPGNSRSHSYLRTDANTRANPHASPTSNPRIRCRSCEQNVPPGPGHTSRCPNLQRLLVQTNTGSHAQHGWATVQRTSAMNTSTHGTHGSGTNFRPRVDLVDGDIVPDQPPNGTGETEVMHIHDLVDESYVQSDDELMEEKQTPEGWEVGTDSD